MMKKRIALLGLLGCMALCSERVQAVTVLFDGQIYELSDRENIRYGSLSRIKAGETQADVNARLKAFFEPLDHKIVASTSTVAPKPTMAPPVPAAPTPEQIRDAAAGMSVIPVRATAASASAAQSSEMCCSGQHRMPSACACVPVTPQRGIMAQDALSAKRMAFSRMNPSDPRYAALRAELDVASELYAAQLAQELGGLAVDYDDEEFARRLQVEMDAELAKNMQSISPALSTGSVTPPTVVDEENVRPHDEQYTDVMVAPGELGSQLTPAEIVDRNEELIRAELALANAENVAATERMLAQEAAREKAERLQAVIAAYATYKALKVERGEEAVLSMLEGQFAEAEVKALTAALLSDLEQVAAAELITELLQ